MYSYLSPQEVWYGREKLIGRPVACAYWNKEWFGAQEPEWYKFAFKTLKSVQIGPHAYTLVYADGNLDSLTSYDTVCVYTVDLEKA